MQQRPLPVIKIVSGASAAAAFSVAAAVMASGGHNHMLIATVIAMLGLTQIPLWSAEPSPRLIFSVLDTTSTSLFLLGTALYHSPALSGDAPSIALLLLAVIGWTARFTRAGAIRRLYNGSLRTAYEEKIREAAAQEERNRLARDLHDSIKQQIFGIQTTTAAAQTRFDSDPPGARAALDNIRASAREAMTEMETMLDQLRAAPLETTGLVEALKRQCETLRFRTGAQVKLDLGDLPASGQLLPGAAQALFRIAQEALSNIARHSRATEVTVTLTAENGQCLLTIRDNGQGFAPDGESSQSGMGLPNMRSRAAEQGGTLTIQSAPGSGTGLSIALPLNRNFETPETAALKRKGLIFVSLALVGLIPSFLMQNDFLVGLGRGLAVGLGIGAIVQFMARRRIRTRRAASPKL